MFLLRILQFILGYVRFSADGGFPERFLSYVSREGVMLWNIRRRGTAIEASVLRRRYKRLPPLAARAGVRLTVLGRKGLPYRAARYTRRRGILVGAAVFAGALYFFSSFIWVVDIRGSRAVPADQIRRVVEELGLRPGAFPVFLNKREIEQQALLRLPDLSGVTVSIHGCEAVVSVRERTWPPDIVPADTPCDVRAARTGQVLDVRTYAGQPMIHDGDSVTAGEVLISGMVEDKNGVTRLVHASGAALARTSRELSVTVKASAPVVREIGRPEIRRTLEIFNFRFPLYWRAPKGSYRQSVAEKRLSISDFRLPFAVEIRTFQQIREEKTAYSPEQMRKLAAERLAEKEKTELTGAKVVSHTQEDRTEAGGYTLTRHYVCEENIAFEEVLQIS